MKKIISVICAFILLLSSTVLLYSCGTPKVTLNVFTCGSFISNGSGGSFNINNSFSHYCKDQLRTRIEVNYVMFPTSNELYDAVIDDKTSCDVLIAPDHIIEKLISNSLLSPIDLTNITNYEHAISNDLRSLPYDPENRYSVPLVYGKYGIAYDANKITVTDSIDWNILWDEELKGRIAQHNDPRLLFASACLKLGIDPNTEDHSLLDRVFDELKLQNELLRTDGYATAGMYNFLSKGEASVGMCSAAEYIKMRNDQIASVDLRFLYPQTSICFVNAISVPDESAHKELAEAYINYLLKSDIALFNANFHKYATSVNSVNKDLVYSDEISVEDKALLYPKDFANEYRKNALRAVSFDTLEYQTELFNKLKKIDP